MRNQTAVQRTAVQCVQGAGGLYIGQSNGARNELLVWFTDPETHSTLMMPAAEIRCAEDVGRHIAESRARFNANYGGAHAE